MDKTTPIAAAQPTAPAFDFEVTEPDQVPRDLVTVDEAKVRAAIEAGLRAAPGLRIFEVKA
jgi:hypothetical protein